MNKLNCVLSRSNIINIHLRLASTRTQEKIVIPKRIHRGPTDILRALESTISKDPNAAHYKYHDDPYLIPMSNIGKRTFALAQEAGRKAAHWVREQHPELFQHNEADPPIKPFFPRMVYNENSEVAEDDLNRAVDEVLVSDAITVYKLLKQKGVPISDAGLLGFLDLLCFYNNEDTLSEEFIEERWYRQSSKGKERARKTWKDGALAEEIFISIENPDANVYSSLVQGMAKYHQVDRAWQLFEEAQKKNLILTTEAYNSIIRVSSFLKESYDLRWTFVTEILSNMNKAKVKPNLGTLNSILEVVSTSGVSRINKQNALKVLTEFKNMGIEPSLASWYYVLITYCKERGPISYILKDIFPHIENKEFEIRDPKDTYFFVTAMDVCRNHLHDNELAQRVNKLLHYGNNYDLIGDSFKESIYYRHYFILMCETEPLNVFMENIYDKLVPNIYVPEPAVMNEILKSIEMNAAVEYVPKLWSDMTIFDHTDRESLLVTVLNVMVNNPQAEGSELTWKFSNIAWSIWERIENQSENRLQKLSFNGEMLGNIMTLVLKNRDFEKACMVMDKLDKGHSSVMGMPRIDALAMFVDHSIEEKQPSKAVQCIQYCADSGFSEAETFAAKVNEKMTLSAVHLNMLTKIVGDHVLVKSDKPIETK